MDRSSDPGTEPVLGEGHYTVALAGAGHRTLEVTRAGPDFQAGPFIVSYLCGSDNESGYRAFAHTLAAVVVAPTAAGKRWSAGLSSMRPAVRSMRRCRDV